MEIETVPLTDLHLDPSNARTHPDHNLEAIIGSLKRFGQAEPLVVHKDTGRIVGGNGRYVAMKKLGWTECDIVRVDLNDIEATALGIALNRTGELAEWDDSTLTKLLSELKSEGAIEGIGFSDQDLDGLLSDLEDDFDLDSLTEGDIPLPPDQATTQPGDLWILGDHRLLCGDSTSIDDVQRLLNGIKASLCATDPPYLVDYTGERPNDSGKDWSDSYREIDIQDAELFFRSVFENILHTLNPHSAIYCWHAHKRTGLIQRIWEELGILDHQQIVWVKPTAVFGRVFYHFRHEPCMMGWLRSSKPEHDGSHEFDSVWEVDWEGNSRVVGNEHPTQKPIELFTRPILKHTKMSDICFEPFSGSGSQLIACEQTKRHCYAIEISPPFVDVAIERWQNATGQEALHEESGKTFNELKALREEKS